MRRLQSETLALAEALTHWRLTASKRYGWYAPDMVERHAHTLCDFAGFSGSQILALTHLGVNGWACAASMQMEEWQRELDSLR